MLHPKNCPKTRTVIPLRSDLFSAFHLGLSPRINQQNVHENRRSIGILSLRPSLIARAVIPPCSIPSPSTNVHMMNTMYSSLPRRFSPRSHSTGARKRAHSPTRPTDDHPAIKTTLKYIRDYPPNPCHLCPELRPNNHIQSPVQPHHKIVSAPIRPCGRISSEP